jgi:hypothetical protein
MKVLFVVVALAVAVSAAPGGYTGNGGVYFNPEAVDQLDYMDHARHAGKKIEPRFFLAITPQTKMFLILLSPRI